jgi:hypothetical protein
MGVTIAAAAPRPTSFTSTHPDFSFTQPRALSTAIEYFSALHHRGRALGWRHPFEHGGKQMTTVVANRTAEDILTDDMLARFHERAPIYDRENRFFQEDFEELRQAGYLTIAVPQEAG